MDKYSESILVVDGSTRSTDLVGQRLRSEGLVIYTSESGLNALAKVDLFKPDIIITNTILPDMSGFDLCKTVKANAANRFTMVLCISNAESKIDRLRAEEVGADDYIDANAEYYLFISKVRSLLRVKQLSNQLRRQYKMLEEKNVLLDKQLEMGMLVQRALIPDIDMRFKDCRLLSRYYPAMGVGGDFYTMLQLTDTCFGIVMGDVSGHGIAAACVTAMLNMMIKNLTPKYFNPDQLLYNLNNELYGLFEKSGSEIYACVFYAVVNTKERYVRYANAGQCLPLFVNTLDNKVTELFASGTPVGMIKDARYEMRSINYDRNDLLLFYTDGLQDFFYKEQPDDFAQRIKEILTDIRYLNNLREILDIICDNFYDTSASNDERMEMDDVSMILCRL